MAPKTRVRRKDPALPDAPSGSVDQETAHAQLAERLILEYINEIRTLSYEDYCRLLLGVELSEGQKAITSVIFDGKAPSEKYREAFFGGMKEAPDAFSLRTAVAICGRGSGKSKVLNAARALHLAIKVDLSMVSPNDPPSLVAIVGPKELHSVHTLGFVKGFLRDRPLLAKVLKAEIVQKAVRITRPDGRQVTIEARAATSGGDSVRGPVLVGVFLEEAAFFEGEGYEVNDEEIYRAARPRLVPDGQIFFGSSPWAQAGKMWELYRDNWGRSDSAVVCKAPTLLVRPSEDTRRAYEAELKTDPDNARREYDAEFLSADSERFFPEAVIGQSVDEALVIPQNVIRGEPVRFGGDFAFASDSSALFGFVERSKKDEAGGVAWHGWVACEIDEQRPSVDVPLVPSQVVRRFAEIMSRCGAKLLVADDHYRQSIEEHLSTNGIALTNAGYTPSHGYVLVRSLMSQGRVKIPSHSRLLAQLRRVRATTKPGGTITIHQPRAKEGGHGDLVSAMVCALAGITVTSSFATPAPKDWREVAEKKAKEDQTARLKGNEDRLKERDRGMLITLKRRLGSKVWRQLTK